MGIALIAVGVLMVVGPIFVNSVNLPPAMHWVIMGLGVVAILGGLAVALFTGWYRKTSADEAFVVTGSAGGSRVILDAGALIIPLIHNVVPVNLKTMKLGVNPNGANALITKDNLRSDILAQFYIRVQADPEHIMNASRSLGTDSVNAEAVESLVSEKLVSALRAIASQMELFEIHTRRDDFAERVKEHVKSDLEANGLLLESVTISELDQTDPSKLSDNNVFDAQGKKKITEITAAAMVERNNLERAAEQARKERDVATRQQILELERKQAEAESTQQTEIAKIQASKQREAQEAVIAQERSVQIARIEKDQALEAAEIGRQQTVETARVGQEKAVQAATIAREMELQKAAVDRDQAVELAGRIKQITLANKETERAKAEELSLIAQAAQERANQDLISVNQIAEAERDASKKLIAARQVIEQDKIRQETDAQVQAFTRVTEAQAEQEAALKQGEARMHLAQADAQAKEMVARGDKAQQMVAVDVSRENVNVEQARVDVERAQLENRQEFADAGIKLEIEKLRIQAEKEVQQEFARALANFLSKGNMTLYGTPEMAQNMMDNMAKGFGARALAEGFLGGGNGSNSSSNGTNHVDALLASLGKSVGPAIEKLTGSKMDSTGQIDALAKAVASNPDVLRAIANAVKGAESPAATTVPAAKSHELTPVITKSHGNDRASTSVSTSDDHR